MLVRFQDIELGQSDFRPGDIIVEDIDFTYPEIRDNDNPREARDGTTPGRDYLGSRTVTIECSTNMGTMRESRRAAAKVLSAWRRASVRLEAGVLAPLDFQAAEDPTWRRVYGRPRRAEDPNFGIEMVQGVAAFMVEFEVMDPVTYAGGEGGLESAEIRMYASNPAPGLQAPLKAPLMTRRAPEKRQGFLEIGGELETPATVSFHGPGRRFSLDGNRGWHVGLRDSVRLAHDEVITIDPLAGTVTDNFGRNRFGALDRRSRLTGIMLDPGAENVFFAADDETHRAYATVSWREAFSTIS